MSLLTRQEIDLREKMAGEITKEIQNLRLNNELQWAMNRAIGVIRAPINHNMICPCSLCVKWEIKSCSDKCDKHRRITVQEANEFAKAQSIEASDKFDCGWCNRGQNEWKITELLYDIENEFPITPCCHTEATEAFTFPVDEHDQRAEDEASYRYSVTGR